MGSQLSLLPPKPHSVRAVPYSWIATPVGALEGTWVGERVGLSVGLSEGRLVGLCVGDFVKRSSLSDSGPFENLFSCWAEFKATIAEIMINLRKFIVVNWEAVFISSSFYQSICHDCHFLVTDVTRKRSKSVVKWWISLEVCLAKQWQRTYARFSNKGIISFHQLRINNKNIDINNIKYSNRFLNKVCINIRKEAKEKKRLKFWNFDKISSEDPPFLRIWGIFFLAGLKCMH